MKIILSWIISSNFQDSCAGFEITRRDKDKRDEKSKSPCVGTNYLQVK